MQFVNLDKNDKFLDLVDKVGEQNVESILVANGLTRCRNIGKKFNDICNSIYASSKSVSNSQKANILNKYTQDSDIFETVALGSTNSWKLLDNIGTIPDMLQIPSTITIPDSVQVLGNGKPISNDIYKKAMDQLYSTGTVDPSIFNEYSSIRNANLSAGTVKNSNPFEYFRIPWGQVTLYSSLSNESMDFPVYPEELDDKVSASYTTMPDLMYTYEPWQIYQSSGPRSNTYTFHMHRDMWTGDHTDGMCNKLIRFCEANCYPEYNGAAINVSYVILYIAGKSHIAGIITDVSKHWDGPIGSDGWYLNVELELTITEVALQPLNYNVIRNKSVME